MVWDMHELQRFIYAQMDAHGWTTQAEVARAGHLSKQLISKLLADSDKLVDMPARSTIAGLARAFNVPESTVMVAAARAYGVPVDEPTVIPTTEGLSEVQLAGELLRRLQHRQESDERGRRPAPIAELRSRRLPAPKPAGKAARRNEE